MARRAADGSPPMAGGLRGLVIAAACLLATACSGIEPTAFPDERENPSFGGLFTGKAGEWIIYRKDQ